MAIQTIDTVSISTEDFKDLSAEILDSLVSGTDSPFNSMMDKFENYLESGEAELDPTQRQAAYADMLKSTYSDINKQAMATALDLLKTNEELTLERYKTEASYNKLLAEIDNAAEQKNLLTKQVIGADRDNELSTERITESKLTQAKTRVELSKQWGVTATLGANTSVEVDNGDGTVTTTTTYGTTTVADTGEDSVIGKQILGYGMVNLKDILKTMDERQALLMNAKVDITDEEKTFRSSLVNYIKGKSIASGDAPTDIGDLS